MINGELVVDNFAGGGEREVRILPRIGEVYER